MEEGRWAARVLSEVEAARAAIAASYLRLWRAAGQPAGQELGGPLRSEAADAQPPSAPTDAEHYERP